MSDRGQALDDRLRKDALYRSLLMDSAYEPAFDRLTLLASKILEVPVALVSLVDERRQFFKSQVGLPEPWAGLRETPLTHSFCQYVVTTGKPLIVPNSLEHPILKDNAAVRDLNVIAYAGIPIRALGGFVLGSFCVIDSKPREWTADQLETLDSLTQAIIAEIELRVEVRERQLAESRLREQTATTLAAVEKARDAALDAARQKSEFLANMSHEIRTPMNGIIGMTDLLRDSPLSTEQRKWIEIVHTCADSLLGIINDILDFSKIEAGKVELETHTFDVAKAVQGTLECLALQAKRKNILLRCILEEGVPKSVRGDSGRLRQILLNLTSNAIKFTEKGEVTVRVLSESKTAGYETLRVEVTDTGCGISDEGQRRLFQPFSQVDGSITRRFGGTGLGLSISRRLVDLMHGALGVRSRPGEGSTFWFTAKFAAHAEIAGGRPSSAHLISISDDDEDFAISHPGIHVLVVDDNSINRLVALGQLRKLGYNAVAISSGKEALEEHERVNYDIIFMDCQMPDMDGFEATAEIRKREGSVRHTPIIAMTADAMAGDRERCIQGGMDDYISKPVSPIGLKQLLTTWVKK